MLLLSFCPFLLVFLAGWEVMSGGVGQQAQDGGQAVQLLLHQLGQLLVLLVPERRTSVSV